MLPSCCWVDSPRCTSRITAPEVYCGRRVDPAKYGHWKTNKKQSKAVMHQIMCASGHWSKICPSQPQTHELELFTSGRPLSSSSNLSVSDERMECSLGERPSIVTRDLTLPTNPIRPLEPFSLNIFFLKEMVCHMEPYISHRPSHQQPAANKSCILFQKMPVLFIFSEHEGINSHPLLFYFLSFTCISPPDNVSPWLRFHRSS